MNNSFWLPSSEQRRTIFMMEALGLIHDLGKLSDTFLKSQESSASLKYINTLFGDPRLVDTFTNISATSDNRAAEMVKKWLNVAGENSSHCAFQERSDLTELLQRMVFTDWTGQRYRFSELMPLLTRTSFARGKSKITMQEWQAAIGKEMQPGLLIGYLHGCAHIEKAGDPHNKQSYNSVFRASPFGVEEQIDTKKHELTTALNDLPLADIEHILTDKRSVWLQRMRNGMSHGLADNRRPFNEVSLWDWGYTVATMTKAATVWVFKNGWPSSLDDITFRTLCINLNRLERFIRSVRISDLLGVRDELDTAFQRVRTLLEETYALANCFYSDETGAYYLYN